MMEKQTDIPAVFKITAKTTGAPATGVWPYLFSDEDGLNHTQVPIWQVSAGVFTFVSPINGLALNTKLSQGVHKGSLKLRLCKDRDCVGEYAITAANGLPYVLNVLPPMVFTVEANGAPVPVTTCCGNDPFKESNVQVRRGDTVTVHSTMPVSQWEVLTGGSTAVNESKTTTSWTGTMKYGGSSGSPVEVVYMSVNGWTPYNDPILQHGGRRLHLEILP